MMTQVPDREHAVSSIPPSPLMPPGYGAPAGARVNGTAVTVIGIILLFFAVLALAPFIGCLVALSGSGALLTSPFWAKLFATLVAAAAVVLYGTLGAGLLARARWARVGAVVALIALYVLGTLAILLLFVTAPDTGASTGTSGEDISTQTENVLGAIAGTLAIVLPPLVKGTLIHFLMRPDVCHAFAGPHTALSGDLSGRIW